MLLLAVFVVAAWLLAVLLGVCLCVTAKDGDEDGGR